MPNQHSLEKILKGAKGRASRWLELSTPNKGQASRAKKGEGGLAAESQESGSIEDARPLETVTSEPSRNQA